ncbi:hypothetical protein BU24DRAFT_66396 [Aaosphaeria arxii CBS 175.79]|uniref:DUF7892 domain-containing protein n=1 Tax=Aaosphaeria arxii CBS 175.79 TaxID=1450172 RepID=A0A6A5XAJ1_9PLEO|nr:uncharacterized protein BU24DRAFT_66396 [Aaosphaeria arxii CBS 175.79]KAF2009876.1 hypothetical protein BU24DRAFT_66396 [Aaosphaeria arxii CBS 175.79]
MEDREGSVASSVDFYDSDRKPATPARDGQNDLGLSLVTSPLKRKPEELEQFREKKPRLESSTPPSTLKPCAGLTPEIWQHIFLFCSLEALGQLLQVNRSFHSYLAEARHASTAKPAFGFLRLLKSDSIWASARNLHATKPPKPFPGFSEMQMWQLISNQRCQFCNRESTFTPGEKIWQKGPGMKGVRIIWPFGVRSCGPCLLQRCQTDSSLLFSTVSAARPALPFALVTSDQHYIPAYTLQAATTPANVEIVKYYFKEHVEELTSELEGALGLGPAAAEEWSKGLDSRGKERMRIAENWERWEVKYIWWKEHQEARRAVSNAPSSTISNQRQKTMSPARTAPSPILHAPVPASKYRSIQLAQSEEHRLLASSEVHMPFSSPNPLTNVAAMPQQTTPGVYYSQHRPPTGPPQTYTPQGGSNAIAPPPRSERNLHDANEAKANRKLDIERRCQQLDPPIPPNVLRHMESFKAAIQIPQPMNDSAWNMLEPRLRSQVSAAQQVEIEHASRVTSMSARAADRRQQEANSKEVKEIQDREWDESQRPIRDRLSIMADEFIAQQWDHGRAVTHDTSPKFAVDLLMHVRRRFYAELEDGIAIPGLEDTANDATGEPDALKPKLVLENMKWVYDNKLKPLTEQFRKELFLCYGNGCESNTRFYGFEGVIQHFGAKHTNTFSVGNIVVAWREAEWPEETPFHPDPNSVKHNYQASGPTGANSGYGSYYGAYSRAGTATPHMQPHLPQVSPGPYHYGGQYSGPFAPPQAQPGYEYPQTYGPPLDAYASYQPMGPPGYGNMPQHSAYSTSPAMSRPTIAPQPAAQGVAESSSVEYRSSLFDKQVSTVIEAAQDIWKQTSGIKDLPNSLRIYVLLQRVISKFQIEFNHEPGLNHLIDAFSNHQISKALKNAPGLSCKSCQEESSSRPASYSSRPEERKTYTALNLFFHFQSQHTAPQHQDFGQGPSALPLDWKEDMIELPGDRFISGLIHAPGMDDDKLLMIATVFPKLFPTPLPRIGVIDNNGVESLANTDSKLLKDSARTGGTPGLSAEKSGPSSLASPYHDSPRPTRFSEEEYDPQRPSLLVQGDPSIRNAPRVRLSRTSPPLTHRRGYSGSEPRYYLSRDALDDDSFSEAREYMQVPPIRRCRNSGPTYADYPERRPIYHDEERYPPGHDEILYAPPPPRESTISRVYDPYQYSEDHYAEEGRQGARLREDPPESSNSGTRAAADRFLDELGSSLASNRPQEPENNLQASRRPVAGDSDMDDGSRYTPPPPNQSSSGDVTERGRPLTNTQRTAPSTVSNGSRYEEFGPPARQIPTPDSAGGPTRIGPQRRRDRHQDYVPSRYYRYLSVGRDEPYARGPSVGRNHRRRYERYEEQRRRIHEQETPQPQAERDYDPPYSRDQSVDQGPQDDNATSARLAPRDYVPLQDRAHPYSPPRGRFARHPDITLGPSPVYVDEYGQPLEVIRVPRDPRSGRGTYVADPSRYHPEDEPEHLRYVSYGRPPPRRYDEPAREYVYYEERPPVSRRPAFEQETEALYDAAPPEIQLETAPATAEKP